MKKNIKKDKNIQIKEVENKEIKPVIYCYGKYYDSNNKLSFPAIDRSLLKEKYKIFTSYDIVYSNEEITQKLKGVPEFSVYECGYYSDENTYDYLYDYDVMEEYKYDEKNNSYIYKNYNINDYKELFNEYTAFCSILNKLKEKDYIVLFNFKDIANNWNNLIFVIEALEAKKASLSVYGILCDDVSLIAKIMKLGEELCLPFEEGVLRTLYKICVVSIREKGKYKMEDAFQC